jgi:hypothetical protein
MSHGCMALLAKRFCHTHKLCVHTRTVCADTHCVCTQFKCVSHVCILILDVHCARAHTHTHT